MYLLGLGELGLALFKLALLFVLGIASHTFLMFRVSLSLLTSQTPFAAKVSGALPLHCQPWPSPVHGTRAMARAHMTFLLSWGVSYGWAHSKSLHLPSVLTGSE